jgi:hypothetical protein
MPAARSRAHTSQVVLLMSLGLLSHKMQQENGDLYLGNQQGRKWRFRRGIAAAGERTPRARLQFQYWDGFQNGVQERTKMA